MCLIIGAKKGTSKNSDFLFEAIEKASLTNKDGIGYAFKKNNQNKIWISKGFQDVDKFIKTLKKHHLKDEDELIVHLRIGNKGAKSVEMNHPFVISSNADTILSNAEYVNHPVLVHNGTLYDYSIHSSEFSDTFFFTKDFMSVPEITSLLKRDCKEFSRVFKEIIKMNKLAFIFPDETPLTILGNFIEDEGYLFSNDSYKKKVYNIGGVEYDYESYNNRWQDDDYAVSHGGAVNSRVGPQTPIDFRSSRYPISLIYTKAQKEEKERLEAIDELNKAIESRNIIKVGERKRDGDNMLGADPKFDIIPPANSLINQALFNKPLKSWLHPTNGHFIYAPMKYLRNQFDVCIFNPCIFNYTHFKFYSPIGNADRNIGSSSSYRILNFDDKDPKCLTKTPMHFLNVEGTDLYSYKGITNQIWLSNTMIVENLMQQINPGLRAHYHTLHRLVQRFGNPSKNLIAQSYKAIHGAIKKDKEENITFKNVGGLTLIGLKLFHNYLVLEMLEYSDAKQQFYDVQVVTKDNSISLEEAAKGLSCCD